jgi:alpha-mannosidase
MYRDVPDEFDAWDIDSMYKKTPVSLPALADISVIARGPLVAAVRVKRRLNNSSMTQDIVLTSGSRRIEFNTTLNWQERHKLLKVCFPCTVHSNEGIHEIQMGHIKRPNHASRLFDADRFEVCNHKWTAIAEESRGCAVLNDSKYGVNVDGNSINLTLLKSALAPDMTADRGTQVFTYAFYAWSGPFGASGLVQHGYDLNCPVLAAPGAAGERSLFTVSDPAVLIETVKPAEDGSSDLILRLYESLHSSVACELSTSLPVKKAVLTDMVEKKKAALAVARGSIKLSFKPFEIKTIRLTIE